MNLIPTCKDGSTSPEGQHSTELDEESPYLSPKRDSTSTWRRQSWYLWWVEAISILLAIGLSTATIIILAYFNGRTVPSWNYSITLNTIAALLATVARASILVTIAGVLGQAKWLWFSQHARPIIHLQQCDAASRGLTGSLKLLFIAPTSIIAVLSCLIVIFSLAIGPFTQQAIKTTPCPQTRRDVAASIPVAHYMDYPGANQALYSNGPGAWGLPVDLKGAMINGLVNPSGNESSVSATCLTGNCTFQPIGGDARADDTNVSYSYSSIGLCSSCNGSITAYSFTARAQVNTVVIGLCQMAYLYYSGPRLRYSTSTLAMT